MVSFYELFCTATGKSYVGSTAGKLNKRMREHRCLLRAGKHSEPELQADWNTHGEKAFDIRLTASLTTPTVDQRRQFELGLMTAREQEGRLYNTKRFAFQPPPGVRPPVRTGFKQSAESNEKRRNAQLGVPKGHGAKISAAKRRKRDEIVSSS
jgi:hypothetical protein